MGFKHAPRGGDVCHILESSSQKLVVSLATNQGQCHPEEVQQALERIESRCGVSCEKGMKKSIVFNRQQY